MHVLMLRLVGLWAPENKIWEKFYWMYSNFCAIFWVMFFLLTQALFFMTVSSVVVSSVDSIFDKNPAKII